MIRVRPASPSRAPRPDTGPSGRTPWAGRPARRYERRRPDKTPLRKIVSENLESWLEWREAAERPVPGYVEEELRGYLECVILCFGFGRALCTGCGLGFVIAFSCQGRPRAVVALTKIFLTEIERLHLVASGETTDAETP